MKKHLLIIGPPESGKTTLAHWLNDDNRPILKEQDAIYGRYTIDVPAGYLENRFMYRYLFSLAQTAACIVCLSDGKQESNFYSPNFVRAFSCQTIGVLSPHLTGEQQQKAVQDLKQAGLAEPFSTFDPTDSQCEIFKNDCLKLVKEASDEIYY